MEILSTMENGAVLLALRGRLDATWADPVQEALDAAIRAGNHRIILDFGGVDYISSAGLRVVIGGYKQLAAIQGGFSVRNAQPGVAKVIELSGLGALLLAARPQATEAEAEAPMMRKFTTASAIWESHGAAAPVRLRAVGGVSAFDAAGGELVEFSSARLGIGIGSLAGNRGEALPRLGEFLAVAGCAAHLPSEGANRPDFLLSEQALIPSAWLSSGLVADGELRLLLRFDVREESRGVPLAEIAQTALDASGAEAAVFVLAAEASGLVGASLRQSPAQIADDPFAFPGVRDRLNFTSERAFRDTTCLVAGVAAKAGSPWNGRLRPLAKNGAALTHVHAAVFPYRPIRKGGIVLGETVRGLFEAGGLQAILHLLNDTREPEGSGDSEFHRGACWVAPVSNIHDPAS